MRRSREQETRYIELIGKSDDDLRAEAERLQAEAKTFRREHRHVRGQVHARIDAGVREAQVAFDGLLASMASPGGGFPLDGDAVSMVRLAALHSLSDAGFATLLHEAVDAAPGYSTLSQAEIDATLAGYEASVREIGVELDRREADGRQAAATEELALAGSPRQLDRRQRGGLAVSRGATPHRARRDAHALLDQRPGCGSHGLLDSGDRLSARHQVLVRPPPR